MILSIENLNKFYGEKQILKDIFLTIEDSDRIGLVGENGCGKTTLLKIITGEEDFDKTYDGKGSISFGSGVKIGILKQNAGLVGENSIKAEMRSVFSKLLSINERMKTLEKTMSNDEKLMAEYAEISTFYEAHDGYNIDVKIKTVLNGMGFEKTDKDQIVSTLSGGEKTRLALAKLLLESPDLLILDEPTNHLDFKTLAWLEDYLKNYKGAILAVSHDRYFLNKLSTSIWEIENRELIAYKGDYKSFVLQKEMRIERLLKEYEAQQAKLAHMQEYIDKNKVRASTANMAKSRQKALDREEKIEKPHISKKIPKIKLKFDINPPKDILFVENLEISVGEKILSQNFDLKVRRGEKIGIVGPNGAGKSTLLKILLKKIPCKNGKIEWCQNSKIAYFEQENQHLNFNNTVIDELHRFYPHMNEQSLRGILGSVLLSGENVFKPVGVISGGERAKLCFAIMMLVEGNILVLDEPTNHLDLTAKEVLENALETYDGTIILVSHDRYLLNRIADRIIEIDDRKSVEYKGNFDFYNEQKKLELEQKELEITALKQEKQKEQNAKIYKTKEMRAKEAKKKARIKELERYIEEKELEMEALKEEMATPEIFSDYKLMEEKCEILEKIKAEHTEFFDEWAELCE